MKRPKHRQVLGKALRGVAGLDPAAGSPGGRAGSWCSPERRGIIQPRATPWEYRNDRSQALKGRNSAEPPVIISSAHVEHGRSRSAALSGLRRIVRLFPGRCPGLHYCGLSGWSSRHFRDGCKRQMAGAVQDAGRQRTPGGPRHQRCASAPYCSREQVLTN
jgi:hypothetical protein